MNEILTVGSIARGQVQIGENAVVMNVNGKKW